MYEPINFIVELSSDEIAGIVLGIVGGAVVAVVAVVVAAIIVKKKRTR